MPDTESRKPYQLPPGWVAGLPLTEDSAGRIKHLASAYPALTEREDARSVLVGPRHWLEAILAEALPVWEKRVPKILPALMGELGRMPRPEELAKALAAERKTGEKATEAVTAGASKARLFQ